MNSFKYEGYWYSKYEPELPHPIPQDKPVEPEFLEKLRKVQSLARVESYRGWSICRCCNKYNGSREYEYNGWAWPEGYEHYLIEHNVHPTPEFREMINLVVDLM